jgi:uncharacterized Zn finger protein
MNVRFVLAPQAALDLVEIWRYIKEQTSLTIADHVESAIREKIEFQIFLLMVFNKNEQGNLTQKQKKTLSNLIREGDTAIRRVRCRIQRPYASSFTAQPPLPTPLQVK